jgi:hypothetical protein
MSAIITDQIRILNSKNFRNGVLSTSNAYYTFVGLTNSTDFSDTWEARPPSPRDSFNQENDYWDTMVAMKRITSSDIMHVVPKRNWSSGSKYDMYRHDYSIDNLAAVSSATNLYSSFFYVMNKDFRVYICLQNGMSPDNPSGKPSLDEPTFTDLEPRLAGSSGDGYVWKYLYTLSPADIIKFDSTEFMPVPNDWETSSDNALVRDNAVSGSIKIVTVKNKGLNVGAANLQYRNVPIRGDGVGAECTITIDENSQVLSVEISNQGSGYTYGTVDLVAGSVPTGTVRPTFDIIIPPQGGHGSDIYRELGASNLLLYARIENDTQNPDFVTGNKIARVGIVENPTEYNSTTILDKPKASVVGALKLVGTGYSTAEFAINTFVSQTIATGTTAFGRVINYDQTTGILKFWQDRYLVGFNTSDGTPNITPRHGYDLAEFTSSPDTGGSFSVIPDNGNNSNLYIDSTFTGASTVINNRTYYYGLNFTDGIALPEVQKQSGNIIYVDNRPSILRSSNQKEDIKIILQF